jgi:transposase-like protein
MRESFVMYPDLVLVDATYKLNNLQMPVFVQLIVDGYGESEIISVFAVSTKDFYTMKHLLNIFKDTNPAWREVKTVLSDKDFTERSDYSEAFPSAGLHICLFHALRSMKREISTEKMRIGVEQKNTCLKILQKITYSKNEDEYQNNFHLLKDTGIQSVLDYYTHSWNDIRNEWVVGLKDSCNFGNNTNNRLESINQKLKQVIGSTSMSFSVCDREGILEWLM